MLQHFLERALNVSLAEMPRVLYGWILRFCLSFGHVVGWTLVVAVAVSRYSIEMLPLVFLGTAVFTMVGMMFFSVLVDRVTARQILALNVFFASTTFVAAFFNYSNSGVFLILVMIASGMFLSQIKIIISNYLEDFFTPREAERVVPTIESSETLAGILGGLFLAFVPFSEFPEYLILLWVAFLLIFIAAVYGIKPRLPFYLERLDQESHHKYHHRLNWNSIMKSVSEIRRVPFLQILLTVLVFHWIIAHFVEFLYTKAVDESVHVASEAEHEISLAHDLGALHIFFHSTALFVEFFVSSRILKSLGTFAGFVVHVVMTLLSSLSLLFGFGYATAVLARNNFEMTTIIQRNAYETAYYAFRYGTLRSLREFFEGIVYPVATIIGTLMIIGMEVFFLEGHLMYVVPFVLVSLSIMMGLFAFQLQKRYTHMTIYNLYSSVPIAQHHAVEIISQKGHKGAYDHLLKTFQKTDRQDLKVKIIRSLGQVNDARTTDFLIKMLESHDYRFVGAALRAFMFASKTLRRTKSSTDGRGQVISALQQFLAKNPSGGQNSLLALRVLAQYDPGAMRQYLMTSDLLLRSEAAIQLWRHNLARGKVRRLVRWLLKLQTKEAYRALAHLVGSLPMKEVRQALSAHGSSSDEELRLLSVYSDVKLNKLSAIPALINLLLYGNEVIFSYGIELIQRLNTAQKRKVAHALMPQAQMEQLPETEEGKRMLERLTALYEACDAYDERAFVTSLIPAYASVS